MKALVLLGCLGLVACGLDASAGGAGGETTNGVSARVVLPSGAVVESATVVARRIGSLADTSVGTDSGESRGITDRDGRASFRLPSGDWVLEARGRDGGLVAAGVWHAGAGEDSLLLRLEPGARLEGRLSRPRQAGSAWIRIPGLGRVVRPDSTGRWSSAPLPAGRWSVRAETRWNGADLVETAAVALESGDTSWLEQTLGPAEGLPASDWTDSVSYRVAWSDAGLDSVVRSYALLLRMDLSREPWRSQDPSRLRLDLDGRSVAWAVDVWDTAGGIGRLWARVDSADLRGEGRVVVRGGNPLAPRVDGAPLRAALGFVSGPAGPAALLGRSDSLPAEGPRAWPVRLDGSFTASVWLRPLDTARTGAALLAGLDAAGDTAWVVRSRGGDTTHLFLEAMGRATGPTYALVPGVWVLLSVTWDAASGSAQLRLNGWLEQELSGLPALPPTRTLGLARQGWPAVVDGPRVRPEAASHRQLVLDGLTQGPQSPLLHP